MAVLAILAISIYLMVLLVKLCHFVNTAVGIAYKYLHIVRNCQNCQNCQCKKS